MMNECWVWKEPIVGFEGLTRQRVRRGCLTMILGVGLEMGVFFTV